MWYCSYNDSIGNNLACIIEDFDLFVLNDASATKYLFSNYTSSIIDLIISFQSLSFLCDYSTSLDT